MACGDFCRQFGALVRKNFLTKRRSKLQLAIELIVPALIMLLIGVIKNSISPKELPAGTPATDTPIVTYEALQNTTVSPNVLCYDNNVFHRCGCHRSTDDYEPPESYLSGAAITFTGAAIWATQHDSDTLISHCQLALGAVASLTDDALCTGTKFIRLMCDAVLGGALDEVPEIDESCGDGATDSLDTSAQGYVTLMQDAVALMAADSDLSIPAAEIDSVCEPLTIAVMPADDGAAADEAADFYDYVTEAFPDTESHWISYDSESEFLDIIGEGDYSQDESDDRPAFVAGIVFTSGSPDWAYTIRANITKSGTDSDSYYMFNVPETESPTENNCKSPTDCPEDDEGREDFSWTALYHQSPVLMLQQLVDNRIMSIEGSTATPPVVRITEFPNAAYEEDGFWSQVGAMFAILVVIAVLYPIANVISALVKEKELRIKEGLKMMGLTDAAHTASWVFHFVCLFFFTSLIMVLASGSLFEFSDPVLVFFYFFLFFMASTAFCFFISAFFSRAKTASTIGTMLFFVSLFPYFAVQSDDTSAGDRRLACLLPPTCLALGTVAFSEYEDSGEGVTADTAGESEDGFTFNDVLAMLFLDMLIFSALAWYAGHVLPSEWGTAKKPWFFLTANYWCPGKGTESVLKDNLKELEHFESEGRDSVEPAEDELRSQVAAGECVAIRGLTKEYKNSTGGSKLAVDKLDLTMYSGQITALLGHNGAGKTTAIGMLTGMIPVTSGSAFVAGRNVNTDMVSIRNSLGVCPQHDILYPDLTVREHLRMYAVLKSVPSSELQEAITNTLNDVGLTEKENELTTTLSGGQKRKLSVGIALIGGSKVIFLDEPTSGMDPHSRRFTWDLIRKNREGRVIVLTTHFMDEADLLGDRVAIMADGALRCCGSSIFLKNYYGVGYNLTIVREIQGAESDMKPAFESGMGAEGKIDEEDIGVNNTAAQEAGVKPIKRLVRSHVKAATLLSNVGAEVSFQLPNDASPSFQGMLTEIDSRKTELGVNSYGLSVTTLEEVFLRVANGTADVESRKEIAGISMMRQSSYSSTMMEAATNKMAGNVGGGGKEGLGIDRSKPLFGRHMMALLKKRLLTFKRDKKMWAFVVLMPAFFVLIGVLILLAVAATNEPSMLLTPEDYNDGSAPFPYATTCAAAAAGTCDPEVLVAEMDISGSAEPVVLGIPATADESGAVELMSEALLEGGYEDNVYGAVSFREADSDAETYDYTVHANYSALHGAPLYVNQINTALLRLVTGNSDLSIAVTMHPLPRTPREEGIDSGFNSFNVSLFMLIAFSFVPAAWMAYIVREKETKCKHQQVVSGVGLEAYWLSSFLWDYVSLMPPVAFTLIVLAAADVTALISGENGVATFLLFLLFGFSMPCYTYLWSFLFKNYSKAQNAFLFHNWITGLILPIATTIMSLFEGTVSDIGRGMAAVLRIVPSFALGDGLMNMSFMEFFGFLDDKDYTALSMRITGNALVYMAICGVIFLGLLLVTERVSAGGSALSGLCGRLSVGRSLGKLTPRQLGDEDEIDEDVRAEMDRVAGGGADNDVVKVEGLRKVYPTSGGAKVAVKSTSLGIPRGECFGLLGINGAGKSSTLAILSGELPPTTGSAYLSGFDVGKNPEEIHRLVGYCPQFDALFETLTGREHLALYASIKGIPADKRSAAVDQKIEEMGLKQYADRPAGGYSGGNKRKLSVAMAMIGDPQIVFLDEPSTGMDPMARRFMWNVIMRIVTENKECAMILTTHSMEECEALCQRIGIMVGGRLRCLGTSQHLKTRFGKGFQLEARVKAITHEETDAMMATLAHATNGQGTLTSDGGMLRAALAAAQAFELEAEVSPTGRGASIYHAIANQGGVSVRDLAAWICVEKKCSRVMAFMQQHFAGAALREKQNAKMRFEFPPQKNQTLAQMFGFIENERESLFIGEYALSQTSLEQVFNGFAAQQEEELGHAAGTM